MRGLICQEEVDKTKWIDFMSGKERGDLVLVLLTKTQAQSRNCSVYRGVLLQRIYAYDHVFSAQVRK